MGRFGLAVSWCLRRLVALQRQQAKAVVAKGNWQAVKAIKNLKRQRLRRPLRHVMYQVHDTVVPTHMT